MGIQPTQKTYHAKISGYVWIFDDNRKVVPRSLELFAYVWDVKFHVFGGITFQKSHAWTLQSQTIRCWLENTPIWGFPKIVFPIINPAFLGPPIYGNPYSCSQRKTLYGLWLKDVESLPTKHNEYKLKIQRSQSRALGLSTGVGWRLGTCFEPGKKHAHTHTHTWTKMMGEWLISQRFVALPCCGMAPTLRIFEALMRYGTKMVGENGYGWTPAVDGLRNPAPPKGWLKPLK